MTPPRVRRGRLAADPPPPPSPTSRPPPRSSPTARADRRRRPRLRGGQAAARVLRAARLRRLAGARARLRARPRPRAARARRRQARRHPEHRRRLRPGARGGADASAPRGPARRRHHRQPAARPRRARAADRRRPRAGAGVFVLVRTSNPGAADVLDLELAGGEPLWERLAAMVAELGRRGGLADVGAVTGATVPEHLARMRELMPRTPFLLPGIGAQGGDVASLAPAFAPGRAAGLVSASRSIANAHEQAAATPPRRLARRPNGCAKRRGRWRRRRLTRRYACPRWPVEALRGSWPRSRWWPSSSRSTWCWRRPRARGTGDEPAGRTSRPLRRPRPRSPSASGRSTWSSPATRPSGIAEKTGVSLEQLEEANPELDPQLLAPGQRIRLPQ